MIVLLDIRKFGAQFAVLTCRENFIRSRPSIIIILLLGRSINTKYVKEPRDKACKSPGVAWRGRSPSKLQSTGAAPPPRGQRFLRKERSAAQTTGANNRHLTVFAPGNFRRSFSKNCCPIAHAFKLWRFNQNTNPGQPNQPMEMNLRFISIAIS